MRCDMSAFRGKADMGLQHLRQIRALCPAAVIPIHSGPLWAVIRNAIEPIDKVGIMAMAFNQVVEMVAPGAPAVVTGDRHHVELADEVAEYDCAGAGNLYCPQSTSFACRRVAAPHRSS